MAEGTKHEYRVYEEAPELPAMVCRQIAHDNDAVWNQRRRVLALALPAGQTNTDAAFIEKNKPVKILCA